MFFIFGCSVVKAQRNTEIGITGGVVQFYPKAQYFMPHNLNNSMDNGLGWSAGVFIQKYLNLKTQPIVEINYSAFSSDIFMQKNPEGFWSPYDGTGRQPIIREFLDTPFNFLSASVGVKYYLTKRFFAYPAIELAKSLNKNGYVNKTSYQLKLGAGLNLKRVHVILEYAYGLNSQTRVLDSSVPFEGTYRDKYLQLKVQVPLSRIR